MTEEQRLRRAENARRNGARSKGPKTDEGKRRSAESHTKHGLYAKETKCGVLPTESQAAAAELRLHFHAFWEPRSLYESRKIEQLCRYAAELDRVEMARERKLNESMAELRKLRPDLHTNDALTAEAEFRASAPGGVFERFELRVRRLNIEISRIERDLIRLKRLASSSGPTSMLLKGKNGEIGSTDLNQRPFLASPDEPALPEVPDPPSQTDIVSWAKESLGFECRGNQADILASTSGRTIVNAARQTGKSTVAAIKAVHEAMTHDNALVILAGPSARQSSQLCEKAREFARKVVDKLAPADKYCDGFKLPNGSRIVAVPATPGTICGFSGPRLIIIDDAALVDDAVYQEALLPMLAAGNGAVLLLSAPVGPSGFFFRIWREQHVSWARILQTVNDYGAVCPDAIAKARREMGDAAFRRAFGCEFVQDPACLISYDLAVRAIRDDIEPLFPNGADA